MGSGYLTGIEFALRWDNGMVVLFRFDQYGMAKLHFWLYAGISHGLFLLCLAFVSTSLAQGGISGGVAHRLFQCLSNGNLVYGDGLLVYLHHALGNGHITQ